LDDIDTLLTTPLVIPVLKVIVMVVGSGNPPGTTGEEQDKSVIVLPLKVPFTLAKTGCVVNSMIMAITENKTLGIEFFKIHPP
jgi:hypothetical protein